MRITKVEKSVEVVINDGHPVTGMKWFGDISVASIDGYPGVVITMEDLKPALLNNWGNENFQLIIKKL